MIKDNTMNMTVTAGKISTKIIRVWFDTILNPLVNGLEYEVDILNSGNIYWKSLYSSFEGFKPLIQFFDRRYSGNFEQLSVYYPDLKLLIDNHDNHLERLNNCVNELYIKLINSTELVELYKQTIDATKNNSIKISDNLSAYSDSKNYRFIAEYVINDIQTLPDEYTLAPIWNESLNQFKGLLKNNDLVSLYQSMINAKNSFKATVESIIEELKQLRFDLSIEFGEPIIMPYEQN